MDRIEIENHLKNIKIKTPTINHILDRIYVRDDLSRLSYTQTKEIIENTKFKITKWELVEDTNFEIPRKYFVKDRAVGTRVAALLPLGPSDGGPFNLKVLKFSDCF